MIESIEIEVAEQWGHEQRLVTVVSSNEGRRIMRARLLQAPLPLGIFTPDAAPPSVQNALNEIDGRVPAGR